MGRKDFGHQHSTMTKIKKMWQFFLISYVLLFWSLTFAGKIVIHGEDCTVCNLSLYLGSWKQRRLMISWSFSNVLQKLKPTVKTTQICFIDPRTKYKPHFDSSQTWFVFICISGHTLYSVHCTLYTVRCTLYFRTYLSRAMMTPIIPVIKGKYGSMGWLEHWGEREEDNLIMNKWSGETRT